MNMVNTESHANLAVAGQIVLDRSHKPSPIPHALFDGHNIANAKNPLTVAIECERHRLEHPKSSDRPIGLIKEEDRPALILCKVFRVPPIFRKALTIHQSDSFWLEIAAKNDFYAHGYFCLMRTVYVCAKLIRDQPRCVHPRVMD